MQITNEDMTIPEKMCNILLKETRERLLSPLRRIEKHGILEATQKINKIMNMIEAGNIT